MTRSEPSKPSFLRRWHHYWSSDLWQYTGNDSLKKEPLPSLLRILSISAMEFTRKKCPGVAASLTFYTMMSTVPILAVAFAIAKGFGLQETLSKAIHTQFEAHPEVAQQLVQYAENMLAHTNAAGIAGIGVAVLLYSVWKLLSNIEGAFNDIWGIRRKRSFLRGVADYMAFVFFFILMAALTAGLPNFVTSFLPGILRRLDLSELVNSAIPLCLTLISYAVNSLLFTLIYIFIPNTRVRFSSALIPGILAGSAFQALQWLIASQMGIFKANPIYGSLAALPVFLIWMQFSWLILLFGAEMSYAIQNLRAYACNPVISNLSHGFRRTLAMVVLAKIAHAFASAEPAVRESRLAGELDIPVRLLRDLLERLFEAKLIVRTDGDPSGEDPAFVPALDTALLTRKYIHNALDGAGLEELPLWNKESRKAIKHRFERIRKTIESLGETESIVRAGGVE